MWFPPKNLHCFAKKKYLWLDWVGATGDLCLKIDNIGQGPGILFLTLLFVLVTAASSKTIAAWSALSNLFSLDLGAWNSKLLCTDFCYSGWPKASKMIESSPSLHLCLCCRQFPSSSKCVVLFCMQTFNSITLKSVLRPTWKNKCLWSNASNLW